MTTATLEKEKKRLREKKGPLEIFRRLNTTYLTTPRELNKHGIAKNNFKGKWNWSAHQSSQYGFISHSKLCVFVFPSRRLGFRVYLNLISLAVAQTGDGFRVGSTRSAYTAAQVTQAKNPLNCNTCCGGNPAFSAYASLLSLLDAGKISLEGRGGHLFYSWNIHRSDMCHFSTPLPSPLFPFLGDLGATFSGWWSDKMAEPP